MVIEDNSCHEAYILEPLYMIPWRWHLLGWSSTGVEAEITR